MRVLILGGGLAGVRAAAEAARRGHGVTVCTPHHALGEDVLGSWAYRTQAQQEPLRALLAGICQGEDWRPLAIKRTLDAHLASLGVKVWYVSRPAALLQAGGMAAGALVEDERGLRYEPADLVLDAGAYGEYAAMATAEGLTFPAEAVLAVRAEYTGAYQAADRGDIRCAAAAMERGHVQLCRQVRLGQSATLGDMRARCWQERIRLCQDVADAGMLGEGAALYPAFPIMPEIIGAAKPRPTLPGLMIAEEWLACKTVHHAAAGERMALVRGRLIPCRMEGDRAHLSLEALPAIPVALAVAGGGTAGVCAALGAAEEGQAPLVLERGSALGGTRTLGGMRGLYYGNRSAVFRSFLARWNEDAARLRQRRNSATEALSVAGQLVQAGVRQRLCATVCGAAVERGRIRRLAVATEEGLLCLAPEAVIDATGTGEVATHAGCAMAFGDDALGRTQNYSQWRICGRNQAAYQHLDQGTLDDDTRQGLTREIRRCLQDGCAWDLVDMLTVREGRRLQGRARVTLEDVARGVTPPDTLCHGFSTYDPHGRSFRLAGRLGLLPAQDAPRYVPVPYGAMLPRELDNLLVCGKALSMDQDAMNYARMSPDVMCVGYLAGRIAAQCLAAGCTLPQAPLAALQQEMREAGALVAVQEVSPEDTALRIACGEERGFAQAVLGGDRRVLAALEAMEAAGAISDRVLADKTRLWFGDTRGRAQLTARLGQLSQRLRGYVYHDRQGPDGVICGGVVGPLSEYWLALQLSVLLARAGCREAERPILALLMDTHVEDAWRDEASAYASIRLDCQTPPSYDRALSLACACELMPFPQALAELRRLKGEAEAGNAPADQPWKQYLVVCLARAITACAAVDGAEAPPL